jgi:glycosyltransferase involved in cell wall biosynthesis
VLKEIWPDLVSTHSTKAGFLGRVAAWSLGIPVIFTAHGWSFTGRDHPIYRWAERFGASFSQRIITVCDADRQLAVRLRVAREDKIVAIHNGVPDISSEGLFANPGKEPPRLIMVARFEAPKDHCFLLQALDQLRNRNWSIDFIGDGPLRTSVEEEAIRLGLGQRYVSLGRETMLRTVFCGTRFSFLHLGGRDFRGAFSRR